MKRLLAIALVLAAPTLVGCGGHEARTLKMRTALDVGDAKGAVAAINEELEVGSDKELPKDIQGDNALLVLDRASVQQGERSLISVRGATSRRPTRRLTCSTSPGTRATRLVSTSSAARSGKYVAPPYEKLLVNTLNILNYLELGDLNGARGLRRGASRSCRSTTGTS